MILLEEWRSLVIGVASCVVAWYFIRRRLLRERSPHSKIRTLNLLTVLLLASVILSATILRAWHIPELWDYAIFFTLLFVAVAIILPKEKRRLAITVFVIAYTVAILRRPLLDYALSRGVVTHGVLSLLVYAVVAGLLIVVLRHLIRHGRF